MNDHARRRVAHETAALALDRQMFMPLDQTSTQRAVAVHFIPIEWASRGRCRLSSVGRPVSRRLPVGHSFNCAQAIALPPSVSGVPTKLARETLTSNQRAAFLALSRKVELMSSHSAAAAALER